LLFVINKSVLIIIFIIIDCFIYVLNVVFVFLCLRETGLTGKVIIINVRSVVGSVAGSVVDYLTTDCIPLVVSYF
jgi:hypothetical protein